MNRIFENQTFNFFRDRESRATFSDIEFHRCHFEDCAVSLTHNPEYRSTIRNVKVCDCSENSASVDTAIIEEVLVDSLKTSGLFQVFGAVFKHVVLRGKLGRMMINNDVLPRGDVNIPYQYDNVNVFREANSKFYHDVDWALDISEAEFQELDIRGVPGRLIRRDPETQVLVTRQRILQGDWLGLPFKERLTPFCLDFMLKQEIPDLVLVAPKRHRNFRRLLEDLQLLRDAGVVEPD
jgi:hypothetical protein